MKQKFRFTAKITVQVLQDTAVTFIAKGITEAWNIDWAADEAKKTLVKYLPKPIS